MQAMDTPPAISIKNLVKRYAPAGNAPAKLALDGVSFDVPQGQIFGLLGPNGAGKSTLINILAGLVMKTGGSAEIWGFDIDADSRNAKRAIGILAAMVLLLATGLVPPAVAGLLAAGAIVLSRVLTPAQAYRSVSWTTVVLVGGMIPLSTAFTATGTADLIASGLLSVVGDSSPTLALTALVVLTMVLGQLISNTATVLIMAPIATVLATDLHVSVLPFMMALTVAGAASFLTPVATAANTMVMEPGGYRFSDYWKLGLPLLLLFLLVAVFWVPLIWRF